MNNSWYITLIYVFFSHYAFSMKELALPLQQTSIKLAINEEKHVVLAVQDGQKVDTYTFMHKPVLSINESDGDFFHFAQDFVQKTGQYIVDLWPLNGTCNSRERRFIDNLFKTSALDELTTQIALARAKMHDPHIRLFVLDLKDGQGMYRNLEKIAQAERFIADLIARHEHAVSKLLLSNGIHFMLQEGSLKAVLLRHLSSASGNYFQEKNGPGPRLLCILCELIMNHFKRGYAVEIQHQGKVLTELHPRNFFMALTKEACNIVYPFGLVADYFKRASLQTYYSAYYRELYGKESAYLQLVSGCFNVEHTFDQSQSTIITLYNTK